MPFFDANPSIGGLADFPNATGGLCHGGDGRSDSAEITIYVDGHPAQLTVTPVGGPVYQELSVLVISDVKKSTWGKIKVLFRQESGHHPPTDQLPHPREPVILVMIARPTAIDGY